MRSSGIKSKPPLSRVFVFFAALAVLLLAAVAFVSVVAQEAPTQNSTTRYLFKQLPFENVQVRCSPNQPGAQNEVDSLTLGCKFCYSLFLALFRPIL